MSFLEEMLGWFLANFSTMIFVLLASGLSTLGSWYAAHYTWNAQRANERRERVYAPLLDELETIEKAVTRYDYFGTTEYTQISSAHLFYLVPIVLKTQIRELYGNLASLSLMAVKLRRKYQEQVQKDINELRPQGIQLDAFRDSNAQSLAMDVAYFLLPGKIADDEPFRTNLPLLVADITTIRMELSNRVILRQTASDSFERPRHERACNITEEDSSAPQSCPGDHTFRLREAVLTFPTAFLMKA